MPLQELPFLKSRNFREDFLKWQPYLSLWGWSSASLTSQLHSNVTGRLPNNSDEDLRGWAEESRLRKNETPAADLRASAGSLHIIKARGCFQWLRLCPSPHRLHQAPHTLIYLRCHSECLPPPGEMGADEIYACMSGNSFFWGGKKRTCNSSEGKRAPLTAVSCLKPHSATDPRQEGTIGDGCSP